MRHLGHLVFYTMKHKINYQGTVFFIIKQHIIIDYFISYSYVYVVII